MMHRRENGFTLVETLVAITVMTLAILAPFSAMQQIVTAARLAKSNLIAASLAQEALEYVRFIRDNNYLAYASDTGGYTSHLLDGLNGTGGPDCRNSNKCTVDGTVAPASAIAACGSTCPALQINDASGLYTQQTVGTSPTPYTRSVSIVQNSGYETATVTIMWNDHGTQSMMVTENFYDWF